MPLTAGYLECKSLQLTCLRTKEEGGEKKKQKKEEEEGHKNSESMT